MIDRRKLIRVRHGVTTRNATYLYEHADPAGWYEIKFDGKQWTVDEDDQVIGTVWRVENIPNGDDN